MTDEQMVVTSSPKKKITFFAAILIVIGSTIGVGIFLRSKSVLENSAGNLAWALVVWLIAGFAVICMALALIEVSSGRNDNLGMIGWSKAFNGLTIYKGNKFFMTYLYLPFTYFFMPYYVILQFQDGITGFGVSASLGSSAGTPWIYFAIGLAITIWMLFSAGLSSRAGNIQNIIITSVKFIPLAVVAGLGIWFAVYKGVYKFPLVDANGESTGLDNVLWKPVTATDLFNAKSDSFLQLTPFLAVFASLGGIFFAFDGFYVTAGIQTEMKQPEKTPAAIVIGLLTLTIIYMIIATTMTLGGSNGSFYGMQDQLNFFNAGWVFGVVNILISFGVLGILNGFSLWCTRFVEDLILEGEIFVPVAAYRYIKHSKIPLVGTLFSFFLSLPIMIIFTAIGGYAYIDATGYGDSYGNRIGQLLSFSDLMANWMAVFAFGYISFAIIGAILNRKRHWVTVVENKNTKWAGYTSSIIILLTLSFLVVDPFVSIGLSSANYVANPGAALDAVVANTATAGLFILFCIIMFASTPIEHAIALRNKAKYDRILNGEICECEKADYCSCEMEKIALKAELNDLVLKTYAEAH